MVCGMSLHRGMLLEHSDRNHGKTAERGSAKCVPLPGCFTISAILPLTLRCIGLLIVKQTQRTNQSLSRTTQLFAATKAQRPTGLNRWGAVGFKGLGSAENGKQETRYAAGRKVKPFCCA